MSTTYLSSLDASLYLKIEKNLAFLKNLEKAIFYPVEQVPSTSKDMLTRAMMVGREGCNEGNVRGEE